MRGSSETHVTPMAEESISNEDAKTPTLLDPPLVTPSTTVASRYNNNTDEDDDEEKPTNARRTLFPARSLSSQVTPLPSKRKHVVEQSTLVHPPAKRRLLFGRLVNAIECQPNVKQIYNIIRKLTGSIGGNGHVGPIYGELTMNSMQKMVDLMVKHCGLDSDSRFIDVGSGIGKPNFHVAQCPGVSFSCGVEVEHTRFALGMTCLKAVLDQAMEQDVEDSIPDDSRIRGNTHFLNHDITHAQTFDPFTHVYMFSIGFPPPLWIKLSDMWNKSLAPFLICYHGPKDIIHSYGFDVELIAQTPTSMHGSKEGHMGYVYKRKTFSKRTVDLNACDPLFTASWEAVKRGLPSLHKDVTNQFQEMMGRGRKTRSRN